MSNLPTKQGQSLLSVVMWAAGISLTLFGFFYSIVASSVAGAEEKIDDLATIASENRSKVLVLDSQYIDISRRLQSIESSQLKQSEKLTEIIRLLK